MFLFCEDDLAGPDVRGGSTAPERGERVRQVQVIRKVGSAGNSSGPHLHFEVWGRTWYDPVDPRAGECGRESRPVSLEKPRAAVEEKLTAGKLD